jgi:pimeloyl-ACP methyl ester carboxylesterase
MTARQAASADRGPEGRPPVFYRKLTVDGLSIFYREAGRPEAPTLLLLHGFPSSSRMYEPLLTRLAGQFHLVAPDYPGFGHSAAPGAKDFTYTFDHLTDVMEHFAEALGLKRYALYLQDYGGPIGFIASRTRRGPCHPECRVTRGWTWTALAETPRILGRPDFQRGGLAREFSLIRSDPAAARWFQSESGNPQSRSLVG